MLHSALLCFPWSQQLIGLHLTPDCRYNPLVAAPCPPLPGFQPLSDRQLTRSPVNFREGRRSSDGLVAQGLVAFHQRLYSKDMSPGPLQLDQVKIRALNEGSRRLDTRSFKIMVKARPIHYIIVS